MQRSQKYLLISMLAAPLDRGPEQGSGPAEAAHFMWKHIPALPSVLKLPPSDSKIRSHAECLLNGLDGCGVLCSAAGEPECRLYMLRSFTKDLIAKCCSSKGLILHQSMPIPERLTITTTYVHALQRNNWPRCCRPFMRHSISEDVPVNRQGLVTRGYWAWIFAAAGCCVDWITITLMWVIQKRDTGSAWRHPSHLHSSFFGDVLSQ